MEKANAVKRRMKDELIHTIYKAISYMVKRVRAEVSVYTVQYCCIRQLQALREILMDTESNAFAHFAHVEVNRIERAENVPNLQYYLAFLWKELYPESGLHAPSSRDFTMSSWLQVLSQSPDILKRLIKSALTCAYEPSADVRQALEGCIERTLNEFVPVEAIIMEFKDTWNPVASQI